VKEWAADLTALRPAGGSDAGERQAMAATLVGQGALAGARYRLELPVTVIGRAEDCDVQIPDERASRHHAEVRREPWRYLLTDLGSRNGTRVNGDLLDGPHHLQNGDTILIATTPLRFEDPNATVPVSRDTLRRAQLPVWVSRARGEAYAFGRRLELAPKEFALLALLYDNGGAVCEKDEIARRVWPEHDGIVSDYNIESLVSRLRHKLEQGGAGAETVVTVKKQGYRLATLPA
jgi:hypothetical protein